MVDTSIGVTGVLGDFSISNPVPLTAFENQGLLDVRSTAAFRTAVGVDFQNLSQTQFSNTGEIRVACSGYAAVGVSGVVGVNLTNRGTIDAVGQSSALAWGVTVEGSLTNFGDISARTEGFSAATGVAIAPASGALINHGSITAEASALADLAIAVQLIAETTTTLSAPNLINDGDIVVMSKGAEVRNGDLAAVFLTNKNESTLKRVYFEGKRIKLKPENPTMKPFYVDARDAQIQGKVVCVFRRTSSLACASWQPVHAILPARTGCANGSCVCTRCSW